jgi:ribosomal protein S18 acetylase RimI-like enzyme
LSIEIRELDYGDAAQVAGFLAVLDAYARGEMGGSAPLDPDVRRRLPEALRAQSNAVVLLACEGATVVGIATCFVGFSTFAARQLLNVHDLAVVPAAQGRGVGRALLVAAEAQARARGFAKLTLEVREDNVRARGLYKERGFGDFELAGVTYPTLFLSKSLAPAKP